MVEALSLTDVEDLVLRSALVTVKGILHSKRWIGGHVVPSVSLVFDK